MYKRQNSTILAEKFITMKENNITWGGFGLGIRNYFKAFSFIIHNRLTWVFIIPLIISLILYFSGFTLIEWASDLIIEPVNQWFVSNPQSFISKLTPSFLRGLIKVFFHLMFFLIFAMYSGYLVLIFLSPLYAWLSEKVEEIETGNKYPFHFQQFMKDIWRGIVLALRNMMYQTLIFLLVVVASFLPVIGFVLTPLAVIILFIVSSYFYGFAYLDYNCERHNYDSKRSILLIRKYKGLAIANGALFSITLYIPFCGVFLSTFASIIAVVGASLAMNQLPEFINTEDKH